MDGERFTDADSVSCDEDQFVETYIKAMGAYRVLEEDLPKQQQPEEQANQTHDHNANPRQLSEKQNQIDYFNKLISDINAVPDKELKLDDFKSSLNDLTQDIGILDNLSPQAIKRILYQFYMGN